MRGAEEDWSQKAVLCQRMGRGFRAVYRHKKVCRIMGSWATQPLCQHGARAQLGTSVWAVGKVSMGLSAL